METKICKREGCGKRKPLTDFPNSKNSKDSKSTWCRACHNAYCAEEIHLLKNRERKRELRKHQAYREMETEREKIRRAKNFKQNWMISLRQNAKTRGIPFSISLADIPDLPKVCPVLKTPFIKGTWSAASIDRINSNKGYIKGNIQIISRLANTMKLHATPEQLLLFAKYWLKLHRQGLI